ncbi:MAG: putative cyclase [Subtercola sp.]|nr:putative cyclase [Subtercola sp.]
MSEKATLRTNWGRWGDADERGTLNLLTPERVSAALSIPRAGDVYTLGSEIGKRGVVTGARNATWHVTTQVENPDEPGSGRAEDVIVMHTHAHTHIDGLGHAWFDGMLYNGASAAKTVGRGGSKHGGVDKYGGIIGTAIVLDVTVGRKRLQPGHAISASELEAAAERSSISPSDADIIIVRTGWTELYFSDRKTFNAGSPGLGPDAAEWIAAADPAVVGMDSPAIEPVPAPPGVHPLANHRLFLHQLGTPLIESLDLAAVGAAGVTDGLFIATPLNITHGLGSPLNPLLVV